VTRSARSYLRGNASALGLSAADVDALTLAERESAPGGLTLLRYRQAYQGIPAFDNGGPRRDRPRRARAERRTARPATRSPSRP
jgi:hypothetical protein